MSELTGKKRIIVDAGCSIHEACRDAVLIAKKEACDVEFDFSSQTLIATPDTDPTRLASDYLTENTRRFEEAKRCARSSLSSVCGNALTVTKTEAIIRHHGYEVTGFVLSKSGSPSAVVDKCAVRWLTDKEWWALMHPTSD